MGRRERPRILEEFAGDAKDALPAEQITNGWLEDPLSVEAGLSRPEEVGLKPDSTKEVSVVENGCLSVAKALC